MARRHTQSSPWGIRWWGVLILMVLMACGGDPPQQASVSEADPASPPSRGIIVAMGDSLTAGFGLSESEAYPALLTQRLAAEGRPFQVINAGVSGETSSGALARIDWVLTLSPDIVILETGANDGLRGLDTERMAANIGALVAAFQEKGVVVILAGMKMVRNLGPDYVGKFEAVYPRIADKYKPVFIPFFLDGVAGKKSLNLSDGIHPNAKGHRIIAERIYPAVIEAIGRRTRNDSSS